MVIIILIVQIYGIEQAIYQGSDNRKRTGRFEVHMNTMSGIFLKNTMINGNFRLKCFWIVENFGLSEKGFARKLW